MRPGHHRPLRWRCAGSRSICCICKSFTSRRPRFERPRSCCCGWGQFRRRRPAAGSSGATSFCDRICARCLANARTARARVLHGHKPKKIFYCETDKGSFFSRSMGRLALHLALHFSLFTQAVSYSERRHAVTTKSLAAISATAHDAAAYGSVITCELRTARWQNFQARY
jgi:hypothetical protein